MRGDASKLGVQPSINKDKRKLTFSEYCPVPNIWQTSSHFTSTLTLRGSYCPHSTDKEINFESYLTCPDELGRGRRWICLCCHVCSALLGCREDRVSA